MKFPEMVTCNMHKDMIVYFDFPNEIYKKLLRDTIFELYRTAFRNNK